MHQSKLILYKSEYFLSHSIIQQKKGTDDNYLSQLSTYNFLIVSHLFVIFTQFRGYLIHFKIIMVEFFQCLFSIHERYPPSLLVPRICFAEEVLKEYGSPGLRVGRRKTGQTSFHAVAFSKLCAIQPIQRHLAVEMGDACHA